MTTLTRNKFDKRDSLEMSLSSSELFKKAGKAYSWLITDATREQDMNEHWDYMIWLTDEIQKKVELKAMKRMSRSGEVQDTWAWIELHGVRAWDKGWLINSKADLICFERKNRFEFYRRLELLGEVLKLVDLTNWVTSAGQAKYKLYSREKRPDILTMVEFSKLSNIIDFTWKKE